VHLDGDNQNKHVGLVIGLISGSIVLLCIFVSAAIFICKHGKPKRTEISALLPLPNMNKTKVLLFLVDLEPKIKKFEK